MGEDCKAKIEVVLNNEDHVEMYLNGKTTTLQNMAISVMTQTIALGADSWDDAKLQLVEAVFALPLALEKGVERKGSRQRRIHRQERGYRYCPRCRAEGVRGNDHGQETPERRVQAAADESH